MSEEMVTIPKKEYEALLDDMRKLSALEVGGVDNWEWYDASLENYWAEKEANERTVD